MTFLSEVTDKIRTHESVRARWGNGEVVRATRQPASIPRRAIVVPDAALPQNKADAPHNETDDALLMLQLLVCSGHLHGSDIRNVILTSQARHGSIELTLLDSGIINGATFNITKNVVHLLDEHFLTFVQAARCLSRITCTGDYPVTQAVEELENIRAVGGMPTVTVSHRTSGKMPQRMSLSAQPELAQPETLPDCEETHERNHPSPALLSTLAAALNRRGDFAESECIQRQKVDWIQQSLGAEHPEVIVELTELAGILCAQEKYGEAASSVRRIIGILERQKDYNGPRLATYLSMLAGIYLKLRLYEEAEPLLGRSLNIRLTYLSAHHPDVTESLHDYAWLLYKTHREGEAEKLQVQARASRHCDWFTAKSA